MRTHFLYLSDAAVETSECISKGRRSRLPCFPHGHAESFWHRDSAVARKQFRERLLIGRKRVQAEDAILLEDGVQLAGAVQTNEQSGRIVGHRARSGSGETSAPSGAVRRHNMHGRGDASHSIAIELGRNHAFGSILHFRCGLNLFTLRSEVQPPEVIGKWNRAHRITGESRAQTEFGVARRNQSRAAVRGRGTRGYCTPVLSLSRPTYFVWKKVSTSNSRSVANVGIVLKEANPCR